MSRSLTPREAEVHVLYASGYTGKQMAAELGISPKTVKNHVSAILRKTNGADPPVERPNPMAVFWRTRPEDRVVNVFRTPSGEHVIVDLPQSIQSSFDFRPLHAACTFISAEVVRVPLHLERAYHSTPPNSTATESS